MKSTDEETPQEDIIHGTGTEHPLWTNGTPEDGSGEEDVAPGQVKWSFWPTVQTSGIKKVETSVAKSGS